MNNETIEQLKKDVDKYLYQLRDEQLTTGQSIIRDLHNALLAAVEERDEWKKSQALHQQLAIDFMKDRDRLQARVKTLEAVLRLAISNFDTEFSHRSVLPRWYVEARATLAETEK